MINRLLAPAFDPVFCHSAGSPWTTRIMYLLNVFHERSGHCPIHPCVEYVRRTGAHPTRILCVAPKPQTPKIGIVLQHRPRFQRHQNMWSVLCCLVVSTAGSTATQLAIGEETSIAPVCGTACRDDNDCPDPSGVCTYCTERICRKQNIQCGTPSNQTNPDLKAYLMVGDSISIGIQPYLFPELVGYAPQHIPINGGPSSKGFVCIDKWLGPPDHIPWDTITFNFGLHSLDNPPTGETESIANYTDHLRYIGATLLNRSKNVVWVDTTPVPLNVTVGPSR